MRGELKAFLSIFFAPSCQESFSLASHFPGKEMTAMQTIGFEVMVVQGVSVTLSNSVGM